MKKYLSVFTAAILVTGCLSACASGHQPPAPDDGKIQIVTTIFPEYDWVMNILGENPAGAEVSLLMDSGVDLHSFQPAADDFLTISGCDLFVCVGGESDRWVEDALKEAVNKDMAVISLLDVPGHLARKEETVEGMQEEGHEDGDPEYDEHVWLSLRNASLFVRGIADTIKTIDPEHAQMYENNTSAYLEKLAALDGEYQAAADDAAYHTLLFGDRFPFRYLSEDYGLDYYAAFAGCSAETEASFETITFLAQKADELSLPAVLTIEGSDHRVAQTIVNNTKSRDQKVLILDSMQSVTAKDIQNGTSYLSVMEKNLSVLKNALN